MVNGISNSLYLTDYQKQKAERNTGDLDKDSFMRILITQLQHQDPLNPMEDREFISQMAQFTSLEQMTNMNTQFKAFIDQQQNKFVSHSELIGKQVDWLRERVDEDGTVRQDVSSGIVTGVAFKNGSVELIVDKEYHISTKSVHAVRLPNDDNQK
ncbi:flagellar hook assembly protein FlgD [Evansella sp. AB-rgal1]|uniref:flagellar hook assembly protein FlgD n=1 Tax=Evansella sp. AB-rgal1 TaxID=3242696 RepID=UPI00359EDA60